MTTQVRTVATALGKDLFTRTNLRILAGLIVVAVLGLFGGFEAAEDETPRVPLAEAAGEPIAASPVEVIIHGEATASDFLREAYPVLELTVTTTDERPVSGLDLGSVLRWADSDESTYPTTSRVGGGPLDVLNPGVPVDIVIDVEGREGESLLVNSLTWRESALDGSMRYLDPKPVIEVQR